MTDILNLLGYGLKSKSQDALNMIPLSLLVCMHNNLAFQDFRIAVCNAVRNN